MTRSDNPFGDLPEWKERRRLQNLRAEQDGVHNPYPPEHQPHYPAPPAYPHAQPQQPAAYAANYDAAAPAYPDQYEQHAYDAEPSVAPDYAPGPYEQRDAYGQGYQSTGAYGSDDAFRAHRAPPAEPAYYNPHLQPGYPAADPAAPPLPGAPQAYYPAQAAPVVYPDTYDDYGANQHVTPQLGPQGFGHSDLGHSDLEERSLGQYDPRQYDPRQYGPGGVAALNDPHFDLKSELDPVWSESGQDATMAGAVAGQGALEDDDEYYDEDEEEEESGFSWKLAAAVILTAAVVTGGGVVLYDSFTSGGNKGQPPIIKADAGPTKTEPQDPGGRQFAHRDSKLLGRLDNSSGAAESAEPGSRVRTVPTVRIGRDGRLILPEAPEAAPAPSETVASRGQAIPGLNIVDSLSGGGSTLGGLPPAVPQDQNNSAGGQAALSNPPAAAAEQQGGTPAVPVIKNRITNRATESGEVPPVPSKSEFGTAWRMEAAVPRSQPVAEQTEVRRVAAPAGASTLGARRPAPTAEARGYVAVLATEPSRMRALQSFAELQQKHPGALRDRVPDVQRADLNSRGLGVMYRLVVGPVGSRNDANSVCATLKTEGYNGCWVKAN